MRTKVIFSPTLHLSTSTRTVTGWGDNDTDTVHGDYCPLGLRHVRTETATAALTPTVMEQAIRGSKYDFKWNETAGADVWPLDPTQWKDSDGDGFGDNQSENATAPDRFRFGRLRRTTRTTTAMPTIGLAFASMDDDNDGIINLNDLCVDSNTSLPLVKTGVMRSKNSTTPSPNLPTKKASNLMHALPSGVIQPVVT